VHRAAARCGNDPSVFMTELAELPLAVRLTTHHREGPKRTHTSLEEVQPGTSAWRVPRDRVSTPVSHSPTMSVIAALVLVLDEAVRDGLLARNPAKDRARRRGIGRSALPMAAPKGRRDFALPDVRTFSQLVAEAVQSGGHQAWGNCVMILATTASRFSEVAGLEVGDVGLTNGLLTCGGRPTPAAAA
jgi:hypothetical protein